MEIFRIFLLPFICPIIPERKKVDVIFTFTHSLLNPRTNYETMDSVFVLGPDIQDTDIQARVTKKWFLYLVSVLRNKGRKMKHSKKFAFFQNFFQKKPGSRILFEKFFSTKR